jgi:hypothetical protein
MALRWEVREKIVLSPSGFASLTISPEGPIHRHAKKLANEAHSWSRAFAPSRTGELRRKIYTRTPKANATSVSVIIECSAPHAYYVHMGTSLHAQASPMVMYAGVRYGSRPPESFVGKQPTMGSVGNFRRFVGAKVYFRDGQKANAFMSRGMAAMVDRNWA